MIKKLTFLFVSYFLISMLVDQWFDRSDWHLHLAEGQFERYDPDANKHLL